MSAQLLFHGNFDKIQILGYLHNTTNNTKKLHRVVSTIIPRINKWKRSGSKKSFGEEIVDFLTTGSMITPEQRIKEIIRSIGTWPGNDITFSQLNTLTGWNEENEGMKIEIFISKHRHKFKFFFKLLDVIKYSDEEAFIKEKKVRKTFIFRKMYNKMTQYSTGGLALWIIGQNLDIVNGIYGLFLLIVLAYDIIKR